MPKFEVYVESIPDHSILVDAITEDAARDQVARSCDFDSYVHWLADGNGILVVEPSEDGFKRRPGDIYELMPRDS